MSDNIHEFSVKELSNALKRHVEDGFSYVRVRGELSGLSRPASGHMYFGLKEEKTVLDGVCWRGTVQGLTFKPEDGLEVICTGKLTTYPDRSKYQLVVTSMEPAGAGAMMALLEERKKKLAAEGLFDRDRKKALPFIPSVIGVVTSPTGAVIRDILHRLSDRFPRHVLVWPVVVQGENAAQQVSDAVAGFNKFKVGDDQLPRPDVLIVARGGGSIEDLWPFNEENVVRAVAASEIPIVSAVGHETDTTLIDYVADERAPTPTAAAERVVPVRAELAMTVVDLGQRLERAKLRYYQQLSDKLSGLARGLPRPSDIMALASQRLDDLSERLPRGLRAIVTNNQVSLANVSAGLSLTSMKQMLLARTDRFTSAHQALRRAVSQNQRDFATRFSAASRLLESLSYQNVLERGYAAVFDKNGKPLTSGAQVAKAISFDLKMKDGVVAARTEEGGSTPKRSDKKNKAKPAKKKSETNNEKQGSLL